MLEEVVKSVSEESSSLVKLQLLSAVMKMFFKRPPECQEMLGALLEHSIGERTFCTFFRWYRLTLTHLHACIAADEEIDMDVHDRGMLYYRLLKHDVKEAQKVVCGQAKSVAEENTVTHRVSHSLQLVDKKHGYGMNIDFLPFSCLYFLSSILFR